MNQRQATTVVVLTVRCYLLDTLLALEMRLIYLCPHLSLLLLGSVPYNSH